VQTATLKDLVRYWGSDYDWRKAEARLNAYPQFVTKIDGVDIHFIHVKSKHPNALPMIMTHGWPGSLIELLDVIDPLTNPTAHGGTAADAFEVVLPSLPGYGFSGAPAELGWDSGRIARAWSGLMQRLGYTRYVAQGGDIGAAVTDAMGRQAPEGLIGIHLNLLAGASGIADRLPATSDEERAAHKALATFRANGFGYFLEQSTRPQTIGYSLVDSPAGLAAWLLDHDTDSYYKIARAFVGGLPSGRLSRESIVDNITLYWLTGSGASAARWYWEAGQSMAAAGTKAPPPVRVPVAFTTFPGEIWAAPRSWAETVYPGLAYFNQAERGGHFAAWEEPALFASELRAAFKPLRSAAQGIARTDVVQHDLDVAGREVVQVRVAFASGAAFGRHSHPGAEVAYVLEGTLEYQLDGQAPVTLKPGASLFIPTGAIHSAKNAGSGPAAELATYIVEKGKPLVAQARAR
jgi:quercetin dioxygenase-like cupin family protein